MDKTTLVNADLERASEVVRALESGNLKIGVALWMYATEYEEWRMFIAARAFDELKPRPAYRYLHELLTSAGLAREEELPIVILPMAHPFIKGLRRMFGKTKSDRGMRIGLQTIGDRFVEDGFVYRIS
jgi:hypothetical protein